MRSSPANLSDARPKPHQRDQAGEDEYPTAAVEKILDRQREMARGRLAKVVDRLQEMIDRVPPAPQPAKEGALLFAQVLDLLLHFSETGGHRRRPGVRRKAAPAAKSAMLSRSGTLATGKRYHQRYSRFLGCILSC